ncbi:hypothetical protein V1277_000748 [Bradyrhizobium sp. AZCC 1588]|uniref:hypothetical protein n=1 Tax=unclassified Bradyrhizobium TaxID=2631580 RepID=UPI002FF3B73A
MNRRSFIGLLREAGATWLIAALFVVAARAAAIPALAHSSHPLVCFVKMEFFPGVCDHLVETGLGWFYISTSNLNEQVQPGQDYHCHLWLGGSEDRVGG